MENTNQTPPPNPGQPMNPPPGTTPPPNPTVQRSNGLAISSLIIGIISLPFGFTVFVGIILGILAIILGALGNKKAKDEPNVGGKGMAIAGLVMGIISIVIAILVVTLFATLFASLGTWSLTY